jgi:acyl carrier protein
MQYVTKEKLIEVLKGVNMDADPGALDPSTDLRSQGVDSLDMMNMLFALEEAFSIEISDDSITDGEWLTIEDMVKNVNKLIAQKETTA